MTPILTIRYKEKGVWYSLWKIYNAALFSFSIGVTLYLLLALLLTMFEKRLNDVPFFLIVLCLPPLSIFVNRWWRRAWKVVTFDKILFYQDRIEIKGETFDPKLVKIRRDYARYSLVFWVLYANKPICVFEASSLLFGTLARYDHFTVVDAAYNHDVVVDVLNRIQQGIQIDGPVEHKLKKFGPFDYVFWAIVLLGPLFLWSLLFLRLR